MRPPTVLRPPLRVLLRLVLAALPAALDTVLRWRRLPRYDGTELGFWACSAALSVLVWFALFGAAAARSGTVRHLAHGLLVLFAIHGVGVQLYVYAQYHAFLDHAAALVGTTLLPTPTQLAGDAGRALLVFGPVLAFAALLPAALRRWAPTEARWAALGLDGAALGFLVAAFVSPNRGARQGAAFDVMFVSAVGQVSRARWGHNETVERVHPGARSPLPVPPIALDPGRRRSVLFILNESVRAASTCVAYDPACTATPFSNQAARARLPLREMRVLDSTTAISISVMWSGLPPESTRIGALSAPLVWEYAARAGYATGYHTSQHLLFGNQGKLVESVHFTRSVCATELEDEPDLDTGADDAKAVDRAIADLGTYGRPFIDVVHLSNTHYPYFIDPHDAPYQPETDQTGPYYKKELKNRYDDAIWHQDRSVARLVDAAHAQREPLVIVYLSDHGEQMHEHGAHGHTGTLYDAEVHVPAWIDDVNGALTPEERTALTRLERTRLTSLDVMPTLLDLLRIDDAPEIQALRARMPGRSLLRGGSEPSTPRVMTNCTGIWGCAYANWGVLAGGRKLFATQGDGDWLCFDLDRDPDELTREPLAHCADLIPLAESAGRGRPFDRPPPPYRCAICGP